MTTKYACLMQQGGKTVINGGKFEVDGTVEGYVFYVSSAGSTIVINKGDFVAKGGAMIVIASKVGDGDFCVEINGGNFDAPVLVYAFSESTNAKDKIKITGGTFSVDPSDYVVDGYEAVKNNDAGTWTVQRIENR